MSENKPSEQSVHPLSRKPTSPQKREAIPPSQQEAQVILRSGARIRPFMTYALVAINVVIFAIGFIVPSLQEQFFIWGWNYPPSILRDGEFYRLVTSMFLHGNALHIFFNAYILYALGVSLEPLLGHVRFGLIYFLGGIAGSVLSIVLGEYGTPSVGASGAIFALFATEAILLYRHRDSFSQRMKNRFRNVLFLIVVNLGLGFVSPQIDNWGHIGGLLGGALVAWILGPRYEFKSAVGPDGRRYVVGEDRNTSVMQHLWQIGLYCLGLVALLFFAVRFVGL